MGSDTDRVTALPARSQTLSTSLGPPVGDAVRVDLEALTGTGRSGSARLAAVERLEALSVVDDVPTSAAAPIARQLAGALAADAVVEPAVRTEVLYLLGQIAEASLAALVGEHGAPAGAGPGHDAAVLACRALLPAILAAAEHLEEDDDADVRVEAADTAEAAQEALDAL